MKAKVKGSFIMFTRSELFKLMEAFISDRDERFCYERIFKNSQHIRNFERCENFTRLELTALKKVLKEEINSPDNEASDRIRFQALLSKTLLMLDKYDDSIKRAESSSEEDQEQASA